MVSFNGIGQWCATFLGEDIPEGSVVKVSEAQTAAACGAGDPFCGVAVAGRDGAVSVQVGGFVTVGYSEGTPAVGFTGLSANGSGGVKSDESGVKRWVVETDETAQTVTVLL